MTRVVRSLLLAAFLLCSAAVVTSNASQEVSRPVPPLPPAPAAPYDPFAVSTVVVPRVCTKSNPAGTPFLYTRVSCSRVIPSQDPNCTIDARI